MSKRQLDSSPDEPAKRTRTADHLIDPRMTAEDPLSLSLPPLPPPLHTQDWNGAASGSSTASTSAASSASGLVFPDKPASCFASLIGSAQDRKRDRELMPPPDYIPQHAQPQPQPQHASFHGPWMYEQPQGQGQNPNHYQPQAPPRENGLLESPTLGTSNTNTNGTSTGTLCMGSVPLSELGLGIPSHLSPAQQRTISRRLSAELHRQERNPPALPASNVPDLPPKEMHPQYAEVPDDADDGGVERIFAYNNEVSQVAQRIDRERNNQAAKKSRETRLEALANLRAMLDGAVAELWWLRLRMIQTGGDPGA